MQSACLIGALAQELANLRVIGIGIRLVDRQRTAVDKLHVKTVFAVYEIGVRDDILWIVVGKAVGRSRIEISNQSKCLFGLFLRHVKETCQHTGARPAQKQLPVHTDNSFGQRIALGKTPELQQEAFLQAASADSGRLQRLNRLQRIFYRRLAHAKFARCRSAVLPEKTVFVERFDKVRRDARLLFTQLQKRELAAKIRPELLLVMHAKVPDVKALAAGMKRKLRQGGTLDKHHGVGLCGLRQILIQSLGIQFKQFGHLDCLGQVPRQARLDGDMQMRIGWKRVHTGLLVLCNDSVMIL